MLAPLELSAPPRGQLSVGAALAEDPQVAEILLQHGQSALGVEYRPVAGYDVQRIRHQWAQPLKSGYISAQRVGSLAKGGDLGGRDDSRR